MSEGFYEGFGVRLRRARKAAGLSQADLAAAIKLTRTSVANIEKGRQKVLLHTFEVMVDVLRVPAEELLSSREERQTEKPTKGINRLKPDARDFVERGLRRYAREEHENSVESNSEDS